MEPDGYLVVTRKMDMSHPVPPYRYFYEYNLLPTKFGAETVRREFENGEYPNWEFVDILACYKGVPIRS